MGRRKLLVCACILIAAVAVIFIAPAYSIQPTALRAWNSSLGLLVALSTLILLSMAAPCQCFVFDSDRPRSGGDLLRVTCTLLI